MSKLLGRSFPLAACLVLAAPLAACDEPLPLPEDVVATDEPIISGTSSPASQNAVVQVRIADEGLCSGTLVAPNLVLTARHCVSKTDPGLECAPDGRPISGGRVHEDHAPEDLVVYVGARANTLVARARGADIVHDGAQNLCNHDIAFVLLDRPITGIPIAPLRLTETTHVGELVTAVGWGLTGRGVLPKARMQRHDVSIVDVGPSRQTPPADFLVGEAICSGDSGGPALSAKGAIVGVVSSGGNGHFDPSHPASGCRGRGTTNVYTRVAAFPALVRRAFTDAHATPRRE